MDPLRDGRGVRGDKQRRGGDEDALWGRPGQREEIKKGVAEMKTHCGDGRGSAEEMKEGAAGMQTHCGTARSSAEGTRGDGGALRDCIELCLCLESPLFIVRYGCSAVRNDQYPPLCSYVCDHQQSPTQ